MVSNKEETNGTAFNAWTDDGIRRFNAIFQRVESKRASKKKGKELEEKLRKNIEERWNAGNQGKSKKRKKGNLEEGTTVKTAPMFSLPGADDVAANLDDDSDNDSKDDSNKDSDEDDEQQRSERVIQRRSGRVMQRKSV